MAVTSEAIRLVADREESGVIEKISQALGITADGCDSQLGIIIVYYHRVSVTFSCCGSTSWRLNVFRFPRQVRASFRPVAGGTHPRPAGIAEHIQRVRIWACSRRWRSCARSDTLVLDASVCCVSSSGSSPAGGATALRREALDHEAFDSGRQGLRSTAGVVVVFGQ